MHSFTFPTGPFLFTLCLLLFAATGGLTAQSVTGMEVEYSSVPLGIDVATPRFSWRLEQEDDVRGLAQQAYRIVVTREGGETVWDSGTVRSGTALGIPYAGEALQPMQRYGWTVTVYNNQEGESQGSSWFETGLLDTGRSAWAGAEWIGAGDDAMILQSQYLSAFRINYSVQVDRDARDRRASLVYGANDIRLLDPYKNLFGLENARDSSYVRLELDLNAAPARLRIFRAGYHPDDRPDVPLFTIEVPDSVIAADATFAPHDIEIASVFGNTQLYVNGVQVGADRDDFYRGGWGRAGLVVNPNGSTDVIGYPMLADIGFAVPPTGSANFTEVRVRNFREPANVLWQEEPADGGYTGRFAGLGNEALTVDGDGYHLRGGNHGAMVVTDPSHAAVPMLRTTFAVRPAVARARLYVTARGVYEVFLNGQRVGEDWFNPGLTQYERTHMYQTYDVTDLLAAGGDNAIGAWLGEGWWSGNYTFEGSNWNYFGDRQSLLARLVIDYADGTRQEVVTDDDWRVYSEGPLRYGSFFQGEVYDARRDAVVEGWSTVGYDDAAWAAAEVVPLEGTAFLGKNHDYQVSYDSLQLLGQIGENARVVDTLTALSVEEVRPGVYVYDMGTNMVGVPLIELGEQPADRDIWLRYAEVLYPDLPAYGEKVGMIMVENLRAAFVHDHYITRAGANTIAPRFTFHGYRYLEITGIEAPLPVEAVRGLVISSIHEVAADYVTSNDNVNQLFTNILRSQYGNFLSIPTDCPQRNERMGWSGDISVFGRTATYFSDADQFFRRHLLGMRDAQVDRGRFPDVAPAYDAFGGMLWGSAGITLPWEVWQQYGDTALLREHYPAMREYMDYLATGIDPESNVMTAGVLGDWLSPEGNQNDNSLLWEAYYIFDLRIMAGVAQVLGDARGAEAYGAQLAARRKHFVATYLDPASYRTVRSGHVMQSWGAPPPEQQAKTLNGKPNFVDTQVSYALPLALGVVEGAVADSLAARLAEVVARRNEDDGGVEQPAYSLMTGFIGTAWISKALSDHGYSDVAYRLLLNEQYPSWLYPVTQGATSIWERLNSYTIEDGFGDNNSMNSFNHYSFGAVGQWLIAHSLGIQRGEPGFRHFVLRPEPDPSGRLKEAAGHYDSPYGRIAAGWTQDGDALTYTVTVPPNTTATLELPASGPDDVREGDGPAAEATGVQYAEYAGGRAVYRLASGSYVFRSGGR